MHRHSPAVHFPLRLSAQLRAGWWGMLLIGAAVLLAWMYSGAGDAASYLWRWFMAVTVWILCAWCSHCALQRQPQGALHWSGATWSWINNVEQVHGLRGVPVVVLDMQWLLVLKFADARQQTQRFVLQRNWAPQAWGDMRRAVYSSAHLTQDASGRELF